VIAFLLKSFCALIIGMLCGAIVKTIMSYALFPSGSRQWALDRSRFIELWEFSRNIAASSLLSLVIMQSDRLILAKMMPLPSYGLYIIALSLATSCGSLAGPYAQQVLSAAYSKAAREGVEVLKRIYYAQRRVVTLIQMASIGGIIGGAPLIITILYDPRYNGMVPFFQILLISAALRLPVASANEAMLALGNSRPMLMSNIVRVAWLAVGGLTGLITGNFMWVLFAIGTIEAVALLSFWRDLHRAGLLSLEEEGYCISAVILCAAIGAGVSYTTLAVWKGS
jgi:O-antigen/teichoic acid export membrane protein